MAATLWALEIEMTDEATQDSKLDEFEESFEGEEETETAEVTEVTEEIETKGEEDEVVVPETEPPAEKEPKLVPIAALLDTRRKLDETRKEVESLRGQIPKSDEKPDPIEDPEGFEKWVRADALAEVQLKQQADEKERLDTSRSAMLESHDDYMDKEGVFMFMARNNQPLIDEMLNNPNPAAFAYEKGKEYLTQQKAALRAEILAEAGESTETIVPKVPSLASASAPTNTIHVEKDEDIDEMFEDQKY
jgi:hypothetical protein